MKKPNFKAEAHKAITRILSLDSRVQRERVLAEFLRDIHDRGEAAAIKAMSGSGERIKTTPQPKNEFTEPVNDFLLGLGNLSVTLKELSKDLAGAR